MAEIRLTVAEWDILLTMLHLEAPTVETLIQEIELFSEELIDAFHRDLRELADAELLTLDGEEVRLTESGMAAVQGPAYAAGTAGSSNFNPRAE